MRTSAPLRCYAARALRRLRREHCCTAVHPSSLPPPPPLPRCLAMLRLASRISQQPAAARTLGGIRAKTTTYIVGLKVEPNAKPILEDLYARTLNQLASFPAASEYRKVVEAMTNERLAVVKAESSIEAIEEKIGAGQVEQLIQQANDELKLMPVLLENAVFEPYEGSPMEEIHSDLKRVELAALHLSRKMNQPYAARLESYGSLLSLEGCRRGIALQRIDIPMQPSTDFPTAEQIELVAPSPPAEA